MGEVEFVEEGEEMVQVGVEVIVEDGWSFGQLRTEIVVGTVRIIMAVVESWSDSVKDRL